MIFYFYDKIEILTKIPLKLLAILLDVEHLKEECRSFVIVRPSKAAIKFGYQSRIAMTVPSTRFFELLLEYDLGDYSITYIEIAKDEIRPNLNKAMFESYRLLKHMVKKYTSEVLIYDARDSWNPTMEAWKKGLFSEVSGTMGTYLFRFALYARISKISEDPCLHSEFRLRGNQIRKKTEIKTIEDCVNFDLGRFYEENFLKYISYQTIDVAALGRWILGWSRKRNFTRRQICRIHINGQQFLDIHNISTSAQLVGWFKKERRRIEHQRGKKSSWDKKIMQVQTCLRFFKVYEIQAL